MTATKTSTRKAKNGITTAPARKRAQKQTSDARSRKNETRSADALLADELRDLIATIDVAEALLSPLKKSLENLLRLAANSVGSEEASVLVRDGDKGGLRFLIAIGEVASKLLKIKIPPGKGIAGFVFSSGQPMAVADVGDEGSFYGEVDKLVGFKTETILATPLQVGEEIVGVLEFVNRVGSLPHEHFTPEDMDNAAYYADAIAVVVDAYQSGGLIGNLFARALGQLDANSHDENAPAPQYAWQTWLRDLRAAPESQELFTLATTLREIYARGAAEQQLCRDLFAALEKFTQERSATTPDYRLA